MKPDNRVAVDVVVRLWVKADAALSTVLDEMDYNFWHEEDIVDTEIVSIYGVEPEKAA